MRNLLALVRWRYLDERGPSAICTARALAWYDCSNLSVRTGSGGVNVQRIGDLHLRSRRLMSYAHLIKHSIVHLHIDSKSEPCYFVSSMTMHYEIDQCNHWHSIFTSLIARAGAKFVWQEDYCGFYWHLSRCLTSHWNWVWSMATNSDSDSSSCAPMEASEVVLKRHSNSTAWASPPLNLFFVISSSPDWWMSLTGDQQQLWGIQKCRIKTLSKIG